MPPYLLWEEGVECVRTEVGHKGTPNKHLVLSSGLHLGPGKLLMLVAFLITPCYMSWFRDPEALCGAGGVWRQGTGVEGGVVITLYTGPESWKHLCGFSK